MKKLLNVVLVAIGLISLPALAICEEDMRDKTDYIVVHCSATTPDMDVGATEIEAWHKARGWRGIGYHAVIKLDGKIDFGRHFDEQGAHVKGYNHCSVGVCVVGGLDDNGDPAMTFNKHQLVSLGYAISMLRRAYPDAEVLGHRDLSPDVDGDGVVELGEWLKDCPCLDTKYFVATGEAVFYLEGAAEVT